MLKVFDAVMEERSVLRASQKVALSQSAVSHSLARLREMLEDELFGTNGSWYATYGASYVRWRPRSARPCAL